MYGEQRAAGSTDSVDNQQLSARPPAELAAASERGPVLRPHVLRHGGGPYTIIIIIIIIIMIMMILIMIMIIMIKHISIIIIMNHISNNSNSNNNNNNNNNNNT